ncbi:ATPase [Paenibacillus selenitireducens]|uniref:ATPase n=1 Tax=Paenibacillus selenitireducens TaxID=1324314 RepID=A0A1T2WYV5_9BACL|nr:DUF3888 domain-containing protein [Paenibacillus selenitireducens]OPA72765.1 ATPase [Paenibacillus selenitireducens]OPA72791.1 ATPase [Paenibacillus selenitireducens]OPA76602.1 ATPase [Paenibacillus selenitireducens]OPA80780.1 ATPase [Paenibacillus selenitireducens]
MKKIIFSFFLSLVLVSSFQTNIASANQPVEDSEELRLQDMLMNLLTPYISEVLDNYYRPNISKTFSPEITPWKIEVTETKRINGFRGFKLEISFEIEPTAGHHVPVGKDRLTYRISYGPSVELINHTHLATYDLPPELQNP